MSPVPEAYCDPGAPALWESDEEGDHEQEEVDTDTVKQAKVDLDLDTVSKEHDERADLVNSMDLSKDEEHSVSLITGFCSTHLRMKSTC